MYQLLIVDDEILAVQGVISSVEWDKLGISTVLSAYNIRQAEEIFKDHPIDLMICDIEMPQGNGLELLAWVKANYPSVVSTFLTCHSNFEYARKAVQLGVVDYLLKPVRSAELESVMRKAIGIIEKEKEYEKASELYKEYCKHLTVNKEQSIEEKVKQYIAEHISDELSREEIAKFFHLSPDYLTRIFKKETGLSISEYLIQERIKVAKNLLTNTNMPISDIVSFIGYSNFSYFSKIFKKATNLNPLEFRKQKRQ